MQRIYIITSVDEIVQDSHAGVTVVVKKTLDEAKACLKQKISHFMDYYGRATVEHMRIAENTDTHYQVQDEFGGQYEITITEQEL